MNRDPASRRLTVAVVVGAAIVCAGTGTAAGLVSSERVGHSFAGAGEHPTAPAGESKLWWNDGSWWASMWTVRAQNFHIFRFDEGRERWIDTGTLIDERSATRADVLWDGRRLYVASHKAAGGFDASAPVKPSWLYRYSYSRVGRPYRLDPGFPVAITSYRPTGLVIDKDSTGQLWATWVQRGRVFVSRTLCRPRCDDAVWGTPSPLPVAGTRVAERDVSTVVAFGRRIGVMWSNQRTGRFYFARHEDRAADTVWRLETLPRLPADDHISLKAGGRGFVFAAVKTTSDGADTPVIALFVREPGGRWSVRPVSARAEQHTRPVVVVNARHGLVHVFATAPPTASSTSRSAVYVKIGSAAAGPAFSAGKGVPVMGAGSGALQDVTSTKQPVGRRTGLLVLAADADSQRYRHHFEPLRGRLPVGGLRRGP